jgi:hypothetical protein
LSKSLEKQVSGKQVWAKLAKVWRNRIAPNDLNDFPARVKTTAGKNDDNDLNDE